MRVSCRAIIYFLAALPVVAQPQAFSVITIRPAQSAAQSAPRMRVLPNGKLIATAIPVIALLSYAYDVPVNPSPRLSALPEWTQRERYDIEADAPPASSPPVSKAASYEAELSKWSVGC